MLLDCCRAVNHREHANQHGSEFLQPLFALSNKSHQILHIPVPGQAKVDILISFGAMKRRKYQYREPFRVLSRSVPLGDMDEPGNWRPLNYPENPLFRVQANCHVLDLP